MDFLSKKIFYITIISLLFLQMPTLAGAIKVERFSSPIKLGNKISQPINLLFSSEGNWKLLVTSLDSRIVNQDNPSYSIPITRLELAELGGNPISNFDFGKIMEIRNGSNTGINNLNLSINVITHEADRPGNYVTEIKFTLLNQNAVVAEDIYSFRFRQEEIASIDFSNKVVNLSLAKDKILQKNASQNLSTPFGLYISSNKDWKLYVRNSNSGDKTFHYFVKVMGGDSSINSIATNEYIPLTQNPILLASGKSTINSAMNCLEKKLINIDYMIKGPEDKFVPAGSRSEEFEYRLETEN